MKHETKTIAGEGFILIGDQDDLEEAIEAAVRDAYSLWCAGTEARDMGTDYDAAVAKLEREFEEEPLP